MPKIMSLTKNLLLLSFTLAMCFGLLIVGDWLVERALQNPNRSDVHETITKRKISEDFPQRNEAISAGFLPALYPSLIDRLDLENPLVAGLPFTDTYFCNEGYGLVRYRSDRFGFRNEDRLWDTEPRRVMIGDSFVHGACVPDESTLPFQLSENLGEPIINLGMNGSDPSHYFTFANLFIPVLQPVDVFLVFYPNDYMPPQRSAIESKYIGEKKEFFAESGLGLSDVDASTEVGKNIILKLELQTSSDRARPFFVRVYERILKHAQLPAIRGMFPRGDNFEMTERALQSTIDLCDAYQCNLLVTFIPSDDYFAPDKFSDIYGDLLAKRSAELGLKFIDGRDFLDRTRGSSDFAPKGGHLSPEGYKKMADAIAFR